MYAFWGQDIDKKTTPFDLNREFRVSFDVGNLFCFCWKISIGLLIDDFQKKFIGKEALLKQKQEGIQKRFIQFLLEDHDIDLDPW